MEATYVEGIPGPSSDILFLGCTNKFDRLYRQFFWSECGADAASNTPNRRSTLTRGDRQLLGILVNG